jgi:hypothetical protein
MMKRLSCEFCVTRIRTGRSRMFVILLEGKCGSKKRYCETRMELLFTDACFTPSRGRGGRKKPRVICEWSFCCFYEFRFRLASAVFVCGFVCVLRLSRVGLT